MAVATGVFQQSVRPGVALIAIELLWFYAPWCVEKSERFVGVAGRLVAVWGHPVDICMSQKFLAKNRGSKQDDQVVKRPCAVLACKSLLTVGCLPGIERIGTVVD